MRINTTLKALVVSGVILSSNAWANAIATDLDNYFTGLGYSSNTTSPAAYKSQAAGSYGSGSLYVRNQVKRYQLVQLDMPSVSSGCSGIDAYTGSISFIKGERLKELGQAVMTNAPGYAFDVALASTIPELKQVKDNLQAMLQQVNNMNINSCQTAQNLIGGVWPKTAASQEKICKDQGTMGGGGYFSDYAKARQGCASSEFNNVLNEAQKDPKRTEQVVMDKNIVWSLLKNKSQALGGNNELAELAMSLTGTVIIDLNGKVTEVPSLIHSQNLIQALLGNDDGSSHEAQVWGCDEHTKCMSVHLKKITIDGNHAFRGHVSALIQSLYAHIKADEKPSVAEKNLIAMSHIPIFRFLTVLAGTEFGVNAVDLNDYSSLLAQDMLSQYLSELIQEVHNATTNSQLTEAIIERFDKRILQSQKRVNQLVPEVGHKLDEKLKLVGRIKAIEKQLAVNAQEAMG